MEFEKAKKENKFEESENAEIDENEEMVSLEDSEEEDDEQSLDDEEEEDVNINLITTSTGELYDPLKKKRGRKPKQKEEEEEKVLKKRGRKPKPKELVEEEDKTPKKRGRKPKDKVYSVNEDTNNESSPQIEKSETVILHLPIKKENENESYPSPHLKKNINYSMISSTYSVQENVNLENVKVIPKKKMEEIIPVQYNANIDNVVAQNEKNDYDLNYSFLDNNEEAEIETNTVLAPPEQVEEKKIDLEKRAEELKNSQMNYNEDDYKPNKVMKKNLKNILYEFVNSNSANSWPETTNTHCWWCCHQFDNTPCALPETYRKEKFYVYGVFCSFNCAASYNLSKNDGDEMWTRYNLLNLMYKKMYNIKFVKIGLAPPRETLKIFGGYMNIDEFRESSLKMDRTYQVIKPPMVAIIPKIEENILSKGLKVGGGVNEHILNKTQSQLKLKRTKPLMNPNSTLQSFMNIKIN